VRRATPYETEAATRRLDAETDALSTGKIFTLIRWLTGRETTGDPTNLDGPRSTELVQLLRTVLETASATISYPALRSIGHDRIVGLLRRKLWRRKQGAKPRLLASFLLSPCTAHTSVLASVIMRHGPPQPSTRHRSLPGVSVCR
jgi:hypothetical protein